MPRPVFVATADAKPADRSASLDAPERDPTARQQLEVFRPPAPRHVRELLSSGRLDEELGGLLRVAALHAGDREDDSGVHRDVAFVQVLRQLDALLGRCQRRLHLALVRRDERAVQEVPGEQLAVAGEPRGLGRGVQQLGCLAEQATREERDAERLCEHRQEFALSGRAREAESAPAVCGRFLEAIEVDLGAREVGDRVEADGQLRVGHRVDQLRRPGAIELGVGDRLREGAREADGGKGRRGQRPVAQLGRDVERPLAPRPRVVVLLAVEGSPWRA